MRTADVNLNRLAVFVAVVEAGSLSAAARRLRLAKAMVTVHVQRLEREVGASLLVRTTRKLRLTETGEAFFRASRSIIQQADDAIAAASRDRTDPRGTLRITLPVDYSAVVAPLATTLSRTYPELRIELLTADRVLDLVDGRIDVAVRLGWLRDSSHQSIRVGGFAQWLVATPRLRAELPVPRHPNDLDGGPLVALTVLQSPTDWTFAGPKNTKAKVRFKTALSCDSVFATRMAVLASAGYGVLTDFAAAEDVATGRLVRVLPQWTLPRGGIHIVFPASSQRPQKVRVFVDALRSFLASTSSSPLATVSARR